MKLTNPKKWSDSWFSQLSPAAKLLFVYITDLCDNAGFIEVSRRRMAGDTALTAEQVDAALQEIGRAVVWSDDGEVIFIKNYLRHQCNLPLNPANKFHKNIFKIYESYKHKFKGVLSPFDGANTILYNTDTIQYNKKGEKSKKRGMPELEKGDEKTAEEILNEF